jgi:hypothetical protein
MRERERKLRRNIRYIINAKSHLPFLFLNIFYYWVLVLFKDMLNLLGIKISQNRIRNRPEIYFVFQLEMFLDTRNGAGGYAAKGMCWVFRF